jgi:hypothetical protein
MAKRLVFLQLAPEFGGTKFGPFAGAEIRLGSDPSRNDIVLPEALGVAMEHVRLVKQQDESFIIAPTERTASVFVWRADGRPGKQITAPVAVGAGDGFSVVTAEGPRFYIVLELPKAAEAAAGGAKDGFGKSKGALTGKSMMKEIKRQGLTKVLTTGLGQSFQASWTFVKSGSIFKPRYIIAGLALASGWIFAGGTACSLAGLGYQHSQTNETLSECQGDLAAAGVTGDDDSLESMVERILDDKEWSETLASDKALRGMYVHRLKVIFANKDKYTWVYKRKENAFAQFRRRLESAGVPPGVVRVLAYAAALEGDNRNREWEYVLDSEGGETCGRGPLLLTWRQAHRLEFPDLQLDARLDARVAGQGNVEEMIKALQATSGEETVIDEGTINREGAEIQGGGVCIFVDGDDSRTEVNKMASQLAKELGSKAPGLPEEDDDHWVVMRLLKLFAADFQRGFEDIHFDAGTDPSTTLDAASSITDTRKTYALEATADLMAKATAIPCLAFMDKSVQAPVEEIKQDFPTKTQCGLLWFLMEYNQLE